MGTSPTRFPDRRASLLRTVISVADEIEIMKGKLLTRQDLAPDIPIDAFWIFNCQITRVPDYQILNENEVAGSTTRTEFS